MGFGLFRSVVKLDQFSYRISMPTLAEKITAELQSLTGKGVVSSSRAANMQMFCFGEENILLHVQCRWRMVTSERVLFGSDDLFRPADQNLDWDKFDLAKDDSVLDVVQRAFFALQRDAPPKVMHAKGDMLGGFELTFDNDTVLQAFCCDSNQGEHSEYWRLLGHRDDGSHFVLTGHGIENGSEVPPVQ